MESYRYVIVGGGLAGGKAVEGIREVDNEGPIALVTQEPHRPYQRPPLSKGVLTGKRAEEVVYLNAEAYYTEHKAALLTGVRATGVDREAQTVTLSDGRVLRYEVLLLATGGRARRLPLPRNELDGIFTLRTLEDARRIREMAKPGKQALVLGGSFVGSEVAAALTALGAEVTMAFPEGRLLERIVPREMSEWLHAVYASHNVRILAGITPQRFIGERLVTQVELSNGAMPRCDMAVMGVGIDLNTQLAQQAGLETRAQDNAVIVNAHLQTSDPRIYAAGDIAAWPDPTFGKRLRVEHWDVANAQGLQAGRNMAGAGEVYDVLPYFFSDLFDLSFEVWGDLSSWDRTVRRGRLETRTFAYYYFSEGRLVGVLAMDRPENEREPMQQLVKAQPAHDDVADRLDDEAHDLSDLIV
jgi:3-phenylpropionate/trans-cinnamate dioxygenase ferredoxin reductase component